MNKNSSPLIYINRETGKKEKENIYHEVMLRFFYGPKFGGIFRYIFSHVHLFSSLFGYFQKVPFSKRKIDPFIKKYGVKLEDFEIPKGGFSSFNDFFTRKLKKGARNLGSDLVIPADGRYLFFHDLEKVDGFLVKGMKFTLEKLLSNRALAEKYKNGDMVIARLCPTDYHRFHFPCDGTPSKPHFFNGHLYSVNPIAVKRKIDILAENKRALTEIKTEKFGTILYLEIGATMVGSIHETFIPNKFYKKGEEKGYFSFGGSCLILLFEPGKIKFDSDLIVNSSERLETLCLFGQSLGSAI